jgi:acetylglutamate kinase
METLKIIKIGGNIIDDPTALQAFLIQFSKIKGPKILVHGGGKLATQMAAQMKVEVKMVKGRRVTNAETLDIITMVYAGKINKNIVAQLQQHDCNALGFTGADGNTIVSVKRPIKDVDYGYAGDIIQVRTQLLETLISANICPVFCAITHDKQGQLLNTNADTIAAELAIAFASLYNTELYYCFEKNGVLRDVEDDESVIQNIDKKSYQELLKQQIIKDGMLPKLTNSMNAIDQKVFKVCLGTSDMLFKPTAKYTTIQAS